MNAPLVPVSSPALFPALGFDPAPGDPAATLALARVIALLAGEAGNAAARLAVPGSDEWTGAHADAFRAHLAQDVVPLIRVAARSFEVAATALAGWSRVMETYAAEAAALERHAEEAQQYAKDSLSVIAQSQARTELTAIRRQAAQLSAEYLAAADRVSTQLVVAGNMAPRPPGLFASLWHDVTAGWDGAMKELGDWVRAHVALLEFISSALNMVSMIAGLLALIPALGLIFGWVALLSAGFATLDDGLLTAFAGGSWSTLAFDAVGMAGGVGSIAAADKLVEIYRATGRAKQMWKVISFDDGAKVAPGLFRNIVHMTDKDWAMAGGDGEFAWRVVNTVSGQASWTTTAIAGTTIPGTVGTWWHDFLTGKDPWAKPATG